MKRIKAIAPDLVLLALTILAAACGSQVGEEDQREEESTLQCEEKNRTGYAFGDPTPLGSSGSDVVTLVGAAPQPRFYFTQTPTSDGQVTATYTAGNVWWVEYGTPSSTATSVESEVAGLAADCPNEIHVEVSAELSSIDGQFNETWPVTLKASTTDSVAFFYSTALENIEGTFTPTPSSVTGLSNLTVHTQLEFTATKTEGTIRLMGESQSGNTASATSILVADLLDPASAM